MAYKDPPPGTLKRKRTRRRADKPSVSGHLHLDDKLKGHVALLSHDLADELLTSQETEEGSVSYLAITFWAPESIVSSTSTQWTIIPCRRLPRGHPDLPHSSIRLSVLSKALQSLRSDAPSRTFRPGSTLEIRIADVVPLPLEAVYVSIDAGALQELDGEQTRYGGGFQRSVSKGPKDGKRSKRTAQASKSKGSRENAEQDAARLIREAFKDTYVLRSGGLVPLPLPAHPVTHSPASPATITACEPVSQGLLTPDTRIIVVSQHAQHDRLPRSRRTPHALEEADEDTSNEAFFTAAEDGVLGSKNALSDEDETSDSQSEAADSDADLSDDLDDMISLSSPAISSQTSGMMSSLTSATPRLLGRQTNGINTPGSVYSSMTSATLRGGQAGRAKTFKAQGLLQRVPEDLLHPKPTSQNDEEARVYVETSALGKLGCFSGDWVQLQVVADPSTSNPFDLGMAMFKDQNMDENAAWRPVRVYGLPDMMSVKTPRYQLGGRSGRRDSISSAQIAPIAPATLHLSPVLLANLGEPSHVRISPLRITDGSSRLMPQRPRITGSSMPPIAKEVTLLRLSTPLSTERSIQPSLFIGLREYFEKKQRVVKSGDLLAIPIDESLGRAVFEGGAADDDVSNNDILSHLDSSELSAPAKSHSPGSAVAWFQVGDVVSPSPSESQDADELGAWNGVATVDPTKTRMGQSGIQQRKLPPTMNNVWQFYHGIRRATTAAGGHLRIQPKSYVSQLQRRLRELISVAMSPRAIHLGLPPLAILITSTQRNIGKAYTASSACLDLGAHVFPIDAYEILSEGAAGGGDNKTEGFLKARADRALSCGPQYTSLLIRHIEALNSDRMATALKDILADCRVLIATTTEIDKVPDAIRGLFNHELDMSAPDEGEREGILQSILADCGMVVSPSVDLASVAVKTAALVAGDLVDVTERAILNRISRLEILATSASISSGKEITVRDIQISGGDSAISLIASDFDKAVDDARKNFADAIGAPKIPNVQWSDVGGLANVKEAVIETIQLPLSRPELFAKGLKKRSGILFYGPPGTGKTLLAKAIATEFSLNFFSVKGPELLNMYIGESEANVRRVFQRARDARPCCVFFDELDSVAPKRGNQGDSGGVMDRIVSQLLAELDGMSDGDEGGGGVFVIGATNRPDLLDQALLRPGRFDKMLYLGVSDTHEKQSKILEALSRK